jgi:hypothetical protein
MSGDVSSTCATAKTRPSEVPKKATIQISEYIRAFDYIVFYASVFRSLPPPPLNPQPNTIYNRKHRSHRNKRYHRCRADGKNQMLTHQAHPNH